MSKEDRIDCQCFHCGKRPSDFGVVADGLECNVCMESPKIMRLKYELRMENLVIVRLEDYQKYISDVIDFGNKKMS